MAFALNVVILCDCEGYRLNRYCHSLDRRISNPILSTSYLILLTLYVLGRIQDCRRIVYIFKI